MKQIADVIEVNERVRKTLAAEDRMQAIKDLYVAYSEYDVVPALLADVFLTETSMGGGHSFEIDVAIAEHVAGVRVEGGRLPKWRRAFEDRPRLLRARGSDSCSFFDFGGYAR